MIWFDGTYPSPSMKDILLSNSFWLNTLSCPLGPNICILVPDQFRLLWSTILDDLNAWVPYYSGCVSSTFCKLWFRPVRTYVYGSARFPLVVSMTIWYGTYMLLDLVCSWHGRLASHMASWTEHGYRSAECFSVIWTRFDAHVSFCSNDTVNIELWTVPGTWVTMMHGNVWWCGQMHHVQYGPLWVLRPYRTACCVISLSMFLMWGGDTQ